MILFNIKSFVAIAAIPATTTAAAIPPVQTNNHLPPLVLLPQRDNDGTTSTQIMLHWTPNDVTLDSEGGAESVLWCRGSNSSNSDHCHDSVQLLSSGAVMDGSQAIDNPVTITTGDQWVKGVFGQSGRIILTPGHTYYFQLERDPGINEGAASEVVGFTTVRWQMPGAASGRGGTAQSTAQFDPWNPRFHLPTHPTTPTGRW